MHLRLRKLGSGHQRQDGAGCRWVAAVADGAAAVLAVQDGVHLPLEEVVDGAL